MRVVAEQMLPQTVTIFNKLKKADSLTGSDIWYKTILENCVWQLRSVAQQNGTQTNVGATISVQVPKAQTKTYLPYTEWKESGKQIEHWTLSLNDYVVLGEVEENVTPSTITSILAKYEPNTCKIQVFEDLTFDGIMLGDNFLEQYANIYSIEGV